ncbi:ABC transporter permease [Streptomyces sp. JH14]|uniref:ABC transporter permease subunit n=1 Tax=Streptomyces sp. JH14 TaxID=2793630 RepID=UPI0023F643FF|nr:ABC transporter permease subunit [Streptomyces sp. JH14]MDF6044460.1 ABC transporter permease [Streptomyces sp. JH14]
MKQTLHAEWTKLRTVTAPWWLLLATVVSTVAVSAATAAAAQCAPTGCHQDVVRLSLTGIQLGQTVVVVLAVLMISGEYSTGMMRTTLMATPRRSTVLAAKAVVLTGVVLVAGAVAVLGCLLVAGLILPGNGFTTTQGHALLSPADGPTLRAAAGSVLYLVLIALLGLGAATAVRDSAAAVAVVLGLLFVLPILTQLVADPDRHRHLQQIAPMTAGLAVQATVDLDALPVGPWAGLGVLAGWAVAALLGGVLALRLRDA